MNTLICKLKKGWKIPVSIPVILVSVILALVSCERKLAEPGPDHAAFIDPSGEYRVHTWWHWMDGAVSREGITRDLESMKQQGISQATILNIGLFNGKDFGVPRVLFDSEQWYAMFRWALEEANRLGITIGAHNCDGWSTSGGPWITPEMSMKQYTWSKTFVQGGGQVSLKLGKPFAEHDFYRDVAVVAYPVTGGLNSFREAAPGITLNGSADASVLADANPLSSLTVQSGDLIEIVFEEGFTAERLAIHPRGVFMWGEISQVRINYTILASDDGKRFREIGKASSKGLNRSFIFDLPETRASFFRIMVGDKSTAYGYSSVLIGEIELLGQDEKPSYSPDIPYLLEKSVSVQAGNIMNFDKMEILDEAADVLPESSIIDITASMNSEGSLQWDAPEGDWMVLRFGYTTTGKTNGPATAEGTGLECDKMDKAAVDLHFENYGQKLIDLSGNMAGNTFKFLLIDSWECFYQNWTHNFEEAFEQSSGYSIIPWIPVLCGETVGDASLSEAFLYDFRKTIAGMIEDNYYRHFSDLCHEQGIELHAEVIYGGTRYPPVDILKTNEFIDLPMFEFWAGNDPEKVYPVYDPSAATIAEFPSWAVSCYGKPVLAAEAYTGYAHYSESPANLKSFGDRAFCSGINQMILHSYVHQPLELKPGMTLGRWAAHFNRNNPWWHQVYGWMEYHKRVQYVLQKGNVVNDVLFYLGDQLPQSTLNRTILGLPYGYRASACNFDVLKNMTEVRDGKIIVSGDQESGLLVLPDNPVMEMASLQVIAKLVEKGAVVCGPRPERMLSLISTRTEQDEFRKLSDDLWGAIDGNDIQENTYGQGRVIHGKSLEDVLRELKTPHQFMTCSADGLELMFIHKKPGDKDVFFVFNQQDKAIHRDCLFRTGNKLPEIWDPVDGSRVKPAIYSVENGLIRIPVSYKPGQALFFVFTPVADEVHITMVEKEGKQLFPVLDSLDNNNRLPLVTKTEEGFMITPSESGDYVFTISDGDRIETTLRSPEIYEITDFKGRIEFRAAYQEGIEDQEITDLRSLADFDRDDIKYFAGTATYTIAFDLPAGFTGAGGPVLLDMGNVEAIAQVSLNGESLGNAWMPGMSFDVSGLLQEQNRLEVVLTTAYRNRIIGDYREYGELRNVWTSTSVENYLSAETTLKPTGLMGPLRLIKNYVSLAE